MNSLESNEDTGSLLGTRQVQQYRYANEKDILKPPRALLPRLPNMRSASRNTCSRPCTFTRTPLVARRFRSVMNGSKILFSPYLSITGEVATATRCIALT